MYTYIHTYIHAHMLLMYALLHVCLIGIYLLISMGKDSCEVNLVHLFIRSCVFEPKSSSMQEELILGGTLLS